MDEPPLLHAARIKAAAEATAHALTRLNFFVLTRSRLSVQTSHGHPVVNCLLRGAAIYVAASPESFAFAYSGVQALWCWIRRFVPVSGRFAGCGRSLLTLSRWILLDHDLFVFAMTVAHVAIAIKR